MARFIFFSKTLYSETPRIRHQLADLLTSRGHEVVFYQRPLFFFKRHRLVNERISQNLEIRQTKQLIHHQLRLFNWVSFVNSLYESSQISLSMDHCDDDVVINFNYDYWFLRKIFRNNKILTLINDDFVAQARLNSGRHVYRELSKTSRMSDVVLTVSYPLFNQASAFTKSVQMFLPWTIEPYSKPVESERKAVLLWAHIDGRVDFDLVEYALSNNEAFKFHFVGPVSPSNLKVVDKLARKYENLVLRPTSTLNDLPLESYFASIIPYKAGVADIEAVTASNKTFQLLAKGLPLITYGMPSFFEHESIFKTSTYKEFSVAISEAGRKFYGLQASIEKLINNQLSDKRYMQIMSIVEGEG